MEMPKFFTELVIALVTTIIAAIIVYILDKATGEPIFGIVASVMIILVMTSLYLYFSHKQEARILGIKKIYKNFEKGPKTLELIENAKNSIFFLGISARTFFETDAVEDLVRIKIKEGCNFKFLLLDPKSKFVDIKANDEGDDPEAWRHDIQASILRIERIVAETGTNKVELKLYESLPIWRLIFIDNALVHVTYYPHGHRGKFSPVFTLDGRKISLFDPFKTFYERLWNEDNEK